MNRKAAFTLLKQLSVQMHKLVELRGGAGSGNWGHSGRPGQVGGSGGGGGRVAGDESAGFSSGKLFGKDMPKDAPPNQPVSTKEGLYELGGKTKPVFDASLNTGQGVDKDIGAKVVRPGSAAEFQAAINEKGSVVIIAPMKGEKRAAEKVNGKYDGDWSRLRDVVRATVAVDSKSDIPGAVDSVRANMEKKGFKLIEVDNRMEKPLSSGYRDINTLWKSKEGFITELQINTKSMLRAKEGDGHKHYEEYRSITEGIKNRPPTPKESKRISKLEDDMKSLYNRAWEN